MTLTCPQCGKRLHVRDELAGKKGKCPACGTVLVIPAGQAAVAETPVQASLAGQASAGEKARTGCPNCSASVEAGVRLCVQCGTDLVTGAPYKAAALERVQPEVPGVAPIPRQRGKRFLTLAAGGTFVVLGLAGLLYLALHRAQKNDLRATATPGGPVAPGAAQPAQQPTAAAIKRVAAGSLVVDGKPQDWEAAGIAPVEGPTWRDTVFRLTPQEHEKQRDEKLVPRIQSVRLAQEGKNLFMLLELSPGIAQGYEKQFERMFGGPEPSPPSETPAIEKPPQEAQPPVSVTQFPDTSKEGEAFRKLVEQKDKEFEESRRRSKEDMEARRKQWEKERYDKRKEEIERMRREAPAMPMNVAVIWVDSDGKKSTGTVVRSDEGAYPGWDYELNISQGGKVIRTETQTLPVARYGVCKLKDSIVERKTGAAAVAQIKKDQEEDQRFRVPEELRRPSPLGEPTRVIIEQPGREPRTVFGPPVRRVGPPPEPGQTKYLAEGARTASIRYQREEEHASKASDTDPNCIAYGEKFLEIMLPLELVKARVPTNMGLLMVDSSTNPNLEAEIRVSLGK